ncbi:hypothetical protein [Seleniivibrio woodruffii]|uniref:Uncharacterized protein n=1 Tax=Seleniivibrio woodruffii TaxID=1078050 RepID=A0A4R1K3Q6_9BACT|nr:hypothetical protein [Seleniivibrio woodruffii]TCK58333.1 hypothetical protein C8D98_2531 [Seleniivibrio woodruffii]TVZ36707.1 hypothetical protein OF66_2341 [Seleniivibrio woodruffii]
MADYIFLNPSPNLLKVAENVRNRGFDVKLVRNEQFPDISAETVHVFYNGTYKTFFQDEPGLGNSKRFMKMKKGFLSGFSVRAVSFELGSISRGLSAGDIVDLSLFRRQAIEDTYTSTQKISSASSFSAIAEDNGNAVIVTGYMEFVAGSEKLSMYDTDFDINQALGNDYIIFMEDGHRVELCRSGNRLVVIGNKNNDNLAFLSSKLHFLNKFSFKRVKELVISRNRMPWVMNSLDKRLILLNDFSYFNVSVKLSSEWFDKVGKQICADRQR